MSAEVTIRKKYRVEMAHQLSQAYTAACADTIHGHSYVIEVMLTGQVQSHGMVRDFGSLSYAKKTVMALDHALLMHDTTNKDYISMLRRFNTNLKVLPFNPTAENIALWLQEEIAFEYDDVVVCVRVHETDSGYAEAGPAPIRSAE